MTKFRVQRSLVLIVALALSIGFAECGKKKEETKQQETAAQEQQTAVSGGEQSSGGETMSEWKPVPPVNFKKLQEFLPKEIVGFTRGELEGATATFGEWSFSSAEVTFAKGEETSIKVSILDYAHITSLYTPFQIWLSGNFNVEDSHGYSRSVKVEGSPGFENFRKDDKRCELTLLVGDRYIVQLTGENTQDMDALRYVVKQIDLSSLAKVTS